MKLLKYIFITLIGLSTLSSCMDVVDVKVPKGEELLAVEGNITDQPGPYYVKLSKTAPYFDQTSNPTVQGASLVISDNEGFEEPLIEKAPGLYATQNIRGKIGNTYKLKIKYEEEEYEALTEIKRVPRIDSVKFVFEEEEEDDDLPAGYEVKYFGPELEGVGDFYRFKIYRNNEAFNEPSDLTVTSDELVDGNYIGDLQFEGWRFLSGDSVKVEGMGINEDAYQFFLEMYIQINNADAALFANPIANVRTNIRNLNPNSKKKAVGFFYGAGVYRLKGIVVDENSVIRN